MYGGNDDPPRRQDALTFECSPDWGSNMSKRIEKTLASLLFALVTSGGGSKMH
jgi:hypothetical protein